MRHITLGAACAAAFILTITTAAPAQHNLLFSTLSGHPTAQVPGRPGVEFTDFRRPIRSPDGRLWIMGVRTTTGSVLLADLDDGLGPRVLLEESQPAPWAPAETIGDLWTDRTMTILNDGRYAFANGTSGGDPASNRYIIVFDGATFSIAAQEGQPVPASAGLPAGTLYGSTLDTPQLDTLGRVGFRATLTGVPSSQNLALFFNDLIVAREGVDSPIGQLAPVPETYLDFTTRAYYRSADGATWIANARLNGNLAQDRIVAVDGAVVAQEGATLPGFTSPVGGISPFQPINDVQMTTSGDWFIRATNADGVAWTMRNGAIIARTFTPITPGAIENWDPFLFTLTFFTSIGNDRGDWLVGGTTDTFPIDFGGVMVLNGEHVVVRSFDPIDLNGDGLANDDFFINNFLFDDCFFTDDGRLLLVIVTRDNLGTTMGEAVLDIDLSSLIGARCLCETDGNDAQVDVFDLLTYLALWFAADPAADIDGAQGVDVFDLLAFLDCWFPASAGGPCP